MAVGGSVAMPVFGLSGASVAQEAGAPPKRRVRVIPIYKAPEPLPDVVPPLPADPSDTGTVSGSQEFVTAVNVLPPPRPAELRAAPSIVAVKMGEPLAPVVVSSAQPAPRGCRDPTGITGRHHRYGGRPAAGQSQRS
jgi:hypothetical protein